MISKITPPVKQQGIPAFLNIRAGIANLLKEIKLPIDPELDMFIHSQVPKETIEKLN